MRTYQQTLTAGQTYELTVNGNYFALLEAAGAVDVEFRYIGQSGSTEISQGLQQGYSETFPGMLTSVSVVSSITQTIKYGCGNGVARFDRSTIVQAQATTVTDSAPVTVGVVSALVTAAAASRRRIIFTADTANTADIYLGGVGVSAVNGAIRLEADGSWIEDLAAAAAWYAVASAAGQVLRIQEAS